MDLHTPAPEPVHRPVLAAEAIDALDPRPGGIYIDGTFGAGGHSRLLAARIAPGGTIIAFDRDPDVQHFADELARETEVDIHFVHASYATMADEVIERGLDGVDGILLDLGLSSLQLADQSRGFSFTADGRLDMRFDPTSGRPASALVNNLDERELADLIFRYGEERQSRRIARAIVRERQQEPIETTRRLAEIVERAAGGRRGRRIHPATRTFQALRIAVNDELGELERGLEAGVEALKPGGRFAVISFHSLEDRIVKRFFVDEERGCICPPELPVCVCGRTPRLRIIGKPVRPTADEIADNPRARSAIMRVAERLP